MRAGLVADAIIQTLLICLAYRPAYVLAEMTGWHPLRFRLSTLFAGMALAALGLVILRITPSHPWVLLPPLSCGMLAIPFVWLWAVTRNRSESSV